MFSQNPQPKKYYSVEAVDEHRKHLFYDALEIEQAKNDIDNKNKKKKILDNTSKEKL